MTKLIGVRTSGSNMSNFLPAICNSHERYRIEQ
jgi:hypothetical protein